VVVTADPGRITASDHVNAKQERDRLRIFGFSVSDDSKLKACGRPMKKGAVGTAAEILEQPESCNRYWLCPHCGNRAAQRDQAILERRLAQWFSHGKAAAFLTLTQHHELTDRLADLWDRMVSGWSALKSGSGWKADRESFGIRGFVRSTEVLHHPVTGWNVHFHVVLLLDNALDQQALRDLHDRLSQRFVRGLGRRGGHADARGQDIRMLDPDNPARVARYFLKANGQLTSENGSRTPMGILSHLQSTGEGREVWQEFTEAVTAPPRRCRIRSSKAIDLLCARGI
jgi:hypothetical protein